MPDRTTFEVEEAPSTAAPSGGGSKPVEKWQIAAAGGGIGLILLIMIVILTTGGNGEGGTPGGDDVIDVIKDYDPVQAEKIIWAYHDGDLTGFQQLCKKTIEKHKNGFQFNLLNKDDIFQHIGREDLPAGWEDLKPRYKRDAAINALLARHGGVGMDLNTIMFRSLEPMWEDHIEGKKGKKVAFKGFHYPSRAETATWFMMVGNEGTRIMQQAVARQVKLSVSGSGAEPKGCMEKDKVAGICYGSSVVRYALCAYEKKYCKCYMDETEGCELPESMDIDLEIDLTDPRKDMQVQSGIAPNKIPKEDKMQPMDSIEEKNEEFAHFKRLFNAEIPFITMQAPTSKTEGLAAMTEEDLLKDTNTFFYQWLCLAKLDGVKCD